jgi:hypothetical protein
VLNSERITQPRWGQGGLGIMVVPSGFLGVV